MLEINKDNITVIVQLNSMFSISSFEKTLDKFPQNSIIKINKSNYEDVLKEIEHPPLFTSVWLIYVNTKLTKDKLNRLLSKGNMYVVINCNSKEAYEDIKEILIELNIKYSLVDNSKASKSDLINYCMKSLNIDEDTARYLCKRQGYNMNKVVNDVLNLSIFDKVDRNVIKSYTTVRSTTTLLDLMDYILGLNHKKSYNSMVKLLYNYRYGFSFILEFTKKDLRNRLLLYNYINEGLLDMSNYKEFIVEHKLKMRNYFVYKVLENYKNLSYDKLYLIIVLVESIPDNKYSLYKYIQLLKMGVNKNE